MKQKALALVAASLLTACQCGRKSDEARLKEAVDHTSVHLYLALKLALTQGGQDPDVLAAREQVQAVLRASSALWGKGARPEGAKPVELDPRVAARLGLSLLKLKGQGAELLRSGRDEQLAPVTGPLLALVSKGPPLQLDRSVDHALLLTGLFFLKSHPRSPVPIPEQVVLYEAYRTQPDALPVAPVAPLLRAMKAFIYSTHQLCDLAEAKEFATRMKTIEEVAFEVHLLEAYLALEEGDAADAKRTLLLAQADPRATPAQREGLNRVLAAVDANDKKLLGTFFNRYEFARLISSVAFNELDRAGVDDAIEASQPFLALKAFLETAARSLNALSPPSTDQVKEKARNAFSRFFD